MEMSWLNGAATLPANQGNHAYSSAASNRLLIHPSQVQTSLNVQMHPAEGADGGSNQLQHSCASAQFGGGGSGAPGNVKMTRRWQPCSGVTPANVLLKNEVDMFMPIKCSLCDFWTNSDFVLKSHIAECHLTHAETQTILTITPGTAHISVLSESALAAASSSGQAVSSRIKLAGGNARCKCKKAKKFGCELCDFRTGQKQSLMQHVLAVHEKRRPYQCPKCHYRCARKQNLDKHVLGVHERVRPFDCHLCQASFSQKVTLNNHVRGVHEKSKPFVCPHCDYRCAYRGNLNMHVMTVHEKRKPFHCSQCGYACTQRSALKRHIQGVHDKASPAVPDSSTVAIIKVEQDALAAAAV